MFIITTDRGTDVWLSLPGAWQDVLIQSTDGYIGGSWRLGNTRIPTFVLADLHAAGDTIDLIASAYDIHHVDVMAAVWFETTNHGRIIKAYAQARRFVRTLHAALRSVFGAH